MLTTIDNPFNPFDDFESWLMFDIEKQHFSCERLARIVNITDEMSPSEIDFETERAIDEIIKYDVEDIYQKVTRPIA
jgi:hypothetical protein